MKRSLRFWLALTVVLLVVAIGVNCGGLGPSSFGGGGDSVFGGDEVHADALRRALMHRYR
jgi:hypothetical protein